ncbi:hypothetical protein ADK70_09475 [Streptomyces rimosus subsp. pseudoverticillatus]|uniref:hypothetical protein n=1 Tax=Streptomyces rimosus TaxID=1927 RepID=UPI0006B2A10F|nr:hypothetical protein [Streptomyces rimosus]KOT96478.1 hypothetical protein ADK70_09475 [Streptomyces rimosus subsp. pseudoverticillatus]
MPRTLVISPLCLPELDYLLAQQAGERAALGAVRHLTALPVSAAQIAEVDGDLLAEAEALMTTYEGHALGQCPADPTQPGGFGWLLPLPG